MNSTFKRECLFVHTLQPRGYIAECFQLFHVVVEGPQGCLLLVRFTCDSNTGAGDPKIAQILPMGNACTLWGIKNVAVTFCNNFCEY